VRTIFSQPLTPARPPATIEASARTQPAALGAACRGETSGEEDALLDSSRAHPRLAMSVSPAPRQPAARSRRAAACDLDFAPPPRRRPKIPSAADDDAAAR
jgi:hypothetical protein